MSTAATTAGGIPSRPAQLRVLLPGPPLRLRPPRSAQLSQCFHRPARQSLSAGLGTANAALRGTSPTTAGRRSSTLSWVRRSNIPSGISDQRADIVDLHRATAPLELRPLDS